VNRTRATDRQLNILTARTIDFGLASLAVIAIAPIPLLPMDFRPPNPKFPIFQV